HVTRMLPFFTLAMVAPHRQKALRVAAVAHAAALAALLAGAGPLLIGNALLIAGIIEGALLIGWRLTQLPKSQALEFLLVSPLRPPGLLLAETLVGVTQLGLVTLAGLPVLLLLVADGRLDPLDPLPLLLMPFTWGAITGLGLTVWAYEPRGVRRWGE